MTGKQKGNETVEKGKKSSGKHQLEGDLSDVMREDMGKMATVRKRGKKQTEEKKGTGS